MRTVEIGHATGTLADYARKVAREPLVVTSHGKPLAALVSMAGADAEELALASNAKFQSILEHSWARLKTEGGVSAREMHRRLKGKR